MQPAARGRRHRRPRPRTDATARVGLSGRVRPTGRDGTGDGRGEELRPGGLQAERAEVEQGELPRRGRGGTWNRWPVAWARATVDLAIIGVLTDGGLRRSEAAALTWGDVGFWPDGTARITIQKGQEPAWTPDRCGHREHRPRPARNSARRRRPLPTGVRPDRGDAGQPGPWRCRPGRGVQRPLTPGGHRPVPDRRGWGTPGADDLRALEKRHHAGPVR